MSLIDGLLDLEHRGWQSLCDGTGHEFYGQLMAEDGLMVLTHGTVMDRDQVVASLADAPPWHGFELDDVRLVVLPRGAALVYEATAWRAPDEPPFVALMSSVYTHADSGWRLSLYQQTPVPGRP